MSAAVKTRPRASGGTEIDLIRACACGLRTNATSIVPGNFMSATNWPRPCKCRSSSLRSSDAPTPNRPSGIGRLPLQLLRRFCNGGDDIRIAGAATDIAGQALANLTLRPRASAQDQVARGDQHRRRAVAALQCVVLVKAAAQRLHDWVSGKALDGPDFAFVARDGEHQAGARRLAVEEDRAGAAHAVLAPQMG